MFCGDVISDKKIGNGQDNSGLGLLRLTGVVNRWLRPTLPTPGRVLRPCRHRPSVVKKSDNRYSVIVTPRHQGKQFAARRYPSGGERHIMEPTGDWAIRFAAQAFIGEEQAAGFQPPLDGGGEHGLVDDVALGIATAEAV